MIFCWSKLFKAAHGAEEGEILLLLPKKVPNFVGMIRSGMRRGTLLAGLGEEFADGVGGTGFDAGLVDRASDDECCAHGECSGSRCCRREPSA